MEVQEERKPKNLLTKTYIYWKKNGASRCLKKIYMKFFRLEEVSYRQWQKGALPNGKILEEQRKTCFENAPLLSLVVPVYRTPPAYLDALIDSVEASTYQNYEICLADGSGSFPGEQKLGETIELRMKKNPRIRCQKLNENLGIAGNTNAALAMAKGEYIGLLDHDDLLTPDCLYHCVKAIKENPLGEVFYTDEDKTDMRGKKQYDPHFKPDYNLYLLRTMNYICHFLVVKKNLLERVGGFRQEFDGAQDYDFVLRCCEQAKSVVHIPRILYHWRCHKNSTAENPESKRYAFDAGLRALQEHYKRCGLQAQVSYGIKYGMYHTRFLHDGKPRISVIIPNKDHREDLDLCLRSLKEKNPNQNLEIIIVENNSTEPETFAYYETLKKEDPLLKVVVWEGEFNYSAINNYGAGFARGEYFLLLNNDIEMITEDGIEEMLGFAVQPEVGIVGCKLFYGDDTIQHAGVIVGLGGVAGHAFVGLPRSEYGYMAKPMCTQEMSAVTAACMLVKREAFFAAGGLSEELAVAFNDVDFCLKVREAGYKVIYNADAQAYHYESKSRGLEDTPEKLERFHKEMRLFRDRWQEILDKGDPYYNCNLTLDRNDFTFRNPYWIPQEF